MDLIQASNPESFKAILSKVELRDEFPENDRLHQIIEGLKGEARLEIILKELAK